MMATQLADVELLKPGLHREAMFGTAETAHAGLKDDNRLAASRGIAIAVLASVPIWALIGIMIYLLATLF